MGPLQRKQESWFPWIWKADVLNDVFDYLHQEVLQTLHSSYKRGKQQGLAE